MNLRAIHKACVLFLMLVSMLMPAKMGMGQYVAQRVVQNSFITSSGVVDSLGNTYLLSGAGIDKYNANEQIVGHYDVAGASNLAIGPDDRLYGSRYGSGTIFALDSQGNITLELGSWGSGLGQFQYPRQLAVHPDGNLYIADSGNSRVQVFTPQGDFVRAFGTYGTQPGQLLEAFCLTIDPLGDIYVTDRFNARVTKFDKFGNYILSFGGPGTGDGQWHHITNPSYHTIANISYGRNGVLFVTEHFVPTGFQSRIQMFDLQGNFLGKFTYEGSTADSFQSINVIEQPDGSLWVGNHANPASSVGSVIVFVPIAVTSSLRRSVSQDWATSSVDISIKSIAASGIKEIHYSINMGAEQIVASSTASFTLSDNGTHSISYFAVDNAGNSETAKLATVRIDKIAPVTTLSRSAGLITLSATDAHSGVAKIKYQVNGGAVADYSVPFADTIHKVTYWAEDAAGNKEAAKTDIINAGVQAISVTQPRLNGGTGVVGTVTLDKAAGVGGTVINLVSSLPSVAIVDATVTVPEGATTASFDIDANPVAIDTSVSITASIYETSQSALITVTSPAPVMVTWSTSPVVGGTSSTGTLIISGPAPTGGTTVSLASSSLSALVGSIVTIPAGAMTTTFNVTTNVVSNDTSAVISATVYGVKLKSTISILGPKVTSVTLAAASIASTTTTTGTVTLSTNAPVGGKVVNLSSSNASVASVPVSVTVPAGTRTATFTVTAGSVNANTNATITATTNGSSGTATITVTPPAAVLSTLTTVVTAVTGGVPLTGTVVLTSPAPTGGAVVTLASSSTTVGTVPASVTVAAGATSATFTITTSAVTAASTLTITATRNGVSKTATITVNPVRVVSTLTLNPTSVRGGTNSTGTVTLSGIATEAVVVTLTSGTTAVARVPVSVTVPAGSTTATFTITTLAQTATRTSVITARTGTTSRTATLSVTR